MSNQLTAVIDWETTGLTLHPDADLSLQPQAIEFGGVLLDDRGDEIDSAAFFIDPGCQLDEEVTKITGISNADLVDAPPFKDALPKLRDFFSRASGVIAHNLPFDKAILMYELRRLGVEDFPWPQRELCTVGLYAPEYGKNPKLGQLYEDVLGSPLSSKHQAHRALDDARALAEIVRHNRLWEFL